MYNCDDTYDKFTDTEIDYENLIKNNYGNFINILLKSHKNQQKNLILKCLKCLDNLEIICFCNYVKQSNQIEEILIKSLKKCKVICNFCQFYDRKKIFKLAKSLKYSKLKEIFTLNYFLENPEVIQLIVDENNTISFDDLAILLKSQNNVTINETLMKNVLKAFILSNYNKESKAFNVIKIIVNNEKHFELHTKIITQFVLRAITDKNIEIFKEEQLNNIICSDHVVNHILEYFDADILLKIIDMCKFVNISHKHINKLTVYDYATMKNIIKKIINGVEIVSYFNKSKIFSIGYVEIKVNPMKFIDSILSLNDEYTIKLLSSRYHTQIKYINEQGDLGYDDGGLTKEFYEILSSEIKKITKEVDGFLMFNDENIDTNKLRLIGTLLCRSVYIENISPSINFHPIIGFFLMNGGNGINFQRLIEYLEYFDIEYIKNMVKIYDMSDEEYNSFMYLQCEETIDKNKYIANNFINKYINKNTKIIINSFNYTSQNLWYTKLINALILQKFLSKNDKYDIKSNSIHSLKNNLKIISKGKNYADENDMAYETNTIEKFSETFKMAFLDVLECINCDNLNELKYFLKFWFGTSSIISFTERNSTIDLKMEEGDFDCFESSTCFDRLYIKINRSLFKNINNLKQFISNAIDMSNENQRRCEEIGAFMQVM